MNDVRISTSPETDRDLYNLEILFYENMRGADLSTSSGSDIFTKAQLTGVQVTARKTDWSWGRERMLECNPQRQILFALFVCLFVLLYHYIISFGTTHYFFYVLQSHKKSEYFPCCRKKSPLGQQAPETWIMNPQMNLSSRIGCRVFPQSTKHTSTGSPHFLGKYERGRLLRITHTRAAQQIHA